MPDREKTIRGLTECVKGFGPKDCDECPYGVGVPRPCVFQLMRDALALLKEQEPRVMTREEVNKRAESLDPDPVFVEWKQTGGTAWNVGSINIIAGMLNKGNRDVRVWSSRPSPEQMRDTPWGGDSDAE